LDAKQGKLSSSVSARAWISQCRAQRFEAAKSNRTIEDAFDSKPRGAPFDMQETLKVLFLSAQTVLVLIEIWEKGGGKLGHEDFEKKAAAAVPRKEQPSNFRALVARVFELLTEVLGVRR
jgi:hypothetical protein